MTKSSGRKNNISKPAKRVTKLQHAFRGIREPFVDDVAAKNVIKLQTTGTTTNVTAFATLSPAGLRGAALSGSTFVGGVLIDTPHLLWLYNNALNFGMYRITRAKIVFIGNQGTTTTGTLNLFGSSDPMDVGTGINTAFMQGPGSKSYDLSSAGTKELSLNIPVDSSWKKVSNTVSTVANVAPFMGTTAGIVNVNSVSDLCFGAVAIQVVGVANNTNCGNFFLDYDVEFKDPMSIALNA